MDDHIVNPLAKTYSRGWAGDMPTASQALECRTGEGGAPNPGTMAVTPPCGVGPSEVGTRDDLSASANRTDVLIVRKFISDVGLPAESIDNGSWVYICGYLSGSLNL